MRKSELAVISEIEEVLSIAQAVAKRKVETENGDLNDLSPGFTLKFSELKQLMKRERLRKSFLNEIVGELQRRKLYVATNKESITIVKPYLADVVNYSTYTAFKESILEHGKRLRPLDIWLWGETPAN